MKTILKILVVVFVVTSFAFMANNEEEKENKTEFYYSYIEGYYDGDPDQRGWYFSSIEEMDRPSSSCTAWKEFAESQLKNFTAKCDTYTVYGPFGIGSSSGSHRNKKMAQFKRMGEVWQSNKGPK